MALWEWPRKWGLWPILWIGFTSQVTGHLPGHANTHFGNFSLISNLHCHKPYTLHIKLTLHSMSLEALCVLIFQCQLNHLPLRFEKEYLQPIIADFYGPHNSCDYCQHNSSICVKLSNLVVFHYNIVSIDTYYEMLFSHGIGWIELECMVYNQLKFKISKHGSMGEQIWKYPWLSHI